MQLVQSIFLGKENRFNFFGTTVNFSPREEESLSEKIIDLFFFRSHLQTFIHELGHLTPSLLSRSANLETRAQLGRSRKPEITIHTGNLANSYGETKVKQHVRTSEHIVITSLFGVMFDIGFSLVQLVFFRAIKAYLSVYFLPFLYFSPIYHVVHEIYLQIKSAILKDRGDFGMIRKQGFIPFALSTVVIVCQLSLGLYALE